MKIYLNNYASGGFSLERSSLVGDGHHIENMLAKLKESEYPYIKMIYFYDVLGKGKKDVNNSLLKKGELKQRLKRTQTL